MFKINSLNSFYTLKQMSLSTVKSEQQDQNKNFKFLSIISQKKIALSLILPCPLKLQDQLPNLSGGRTPSQVTSCSNQYQFSVKDNTVVSLCPARERHTTLGEEFASSLIFVIEITELKELEARGKDFRYDLVHQLDWNIPGCLAGPFTPMSTFHPPKLLHSGPFQIRSPTSHMQMAHSERKLSFNYKIPFHFSENIPDSHHKFLPHHQWYFLKLNMCRFYD